MARKNPETFIDELCAILVSHHTLDHAEAKVYKAQYQASKTSNEDFDSFEQYLIDEGLVGKEDILRALSVYYEVPAVDLKGELLDSELVRNFPKDFLIRNEIIPIFLEEDFLSVAAAHPDDPNLLAGIGRYVNTDVEFQVAFAQDIIDAVEENYDKALTEVIDDVDVDTERHEREEFEKDGEIREDEE